MAAAIGTARVPYRLLEAGRRHGLLHGIARRLRRVAGTRRDR
jgi:hypothetical protein